MRIIIVQCFKWVASNVSEAIHLKHCPRMITSKWCFGCRRYCKVFRLVASDTSEATHLKPLYNNADTQNTIFRQTFLSNDLRVSPRIIELCVRGDPLKHCTIIDIRKSGKIIVTIIFVFKQTASDFMHSTGVPQPRRA